MEQMEGEKKNIGWKVLYQAKKAKSLMTNGSVVRRMSMKWVSMELKIERQISDIGCALTNCYRLTFAFVVIADWQTISSDHEFELLPIWMLVCQNGRACRQTDVSTCRDAKSHLKPARPDCGCSADLVIQVMTNDLLRSFWYSEEWKGGGVGGGA